MVNLSLSSSHFPDIWKEGLVRSKLKITVPSAISHAFQRSLKRSEKVAALEISDHISSNQMPPEFQLAYRKNHSTESALLRMRNDLFRQHEQTTSHIISVPRIKRYFRYGRP